jgi:hypothetical protein
MTDIISEQDANAAIARSHAETARRADEINTQEQARRQQYRSAMAAAVTAQGAPSQHSRPGEGVRQTSDTQRHVADMAARHQRSSILSVAEMHDIDTAARHTLMRAELAAGRPLPSTERCAAAGRAALEAARDARLAK